MHQVVTLKRMSVLAVSPLGVRFSWTRRTFGVNVLGDRHCSEVIGVAASRVAAQVVDNQAVRYLAVSLRVRNTVRPQALAVRLDLPVPGSGLRPSSDPAWLAAVVLVIADLNARVQPTDQVVGQQMGNTGSVLHVGTSTGSVQNPGRCSGAGFNCLQAECVSVSVSVADDST